MTPTPYKTVLTKSAPAPAGPFSQVVQHGHLLFLSGMIHTVPETGELLKSTIEAQTLRVLQNMRATLRAAGSDLSHVLKVNIFVKDMDNFAAINNVYAEFFSPFRPARSTVEVARLPLGAQVEIECIATVREAQSSHVSTAIQRPKRSIVAVVGSGVIGLTSAIVLRERGFDVHIVARDLPQDTFSQAFASPWAGANWCSHAAPDDVRQQGWDEVTFRKMLEIGKEHPELVARMPFEEYTTKPIDPSNVWYKDLTFNFRLIPESDLPAGVYGMTYESITLNVPLYLSYLTRLAYQPTSADHKPIVFHRCSTLPSLAAARDLVPTASALVNATGLGARHLSDVRDASVMPIRGQTVLVRAPRVKRCISSALATRGDEVRYGADPTYIIPRALSGDVILGGTFQEGRDLLEPEEATTRRILRECKKCCPELVCETQDEEMKAKLAETEGIEVIRVNVGLRPARKAGARVERESLRLEKGGSIPVVHAYGIGPAGYQASWGIAENVGNLVEEFFILEGGAKASAKL